MNLSRRSFLGGFLTVAAIAATPALARDSSIPLIVGDGVHDDTDGLQAALDGKPFRVEQCTVRANPEDVYISGGRFRITKTLHVRSGVTSYWNGCDLDGRDIKEGAVIHIHGDSELDAKYLNIDIGGSNARRDAGIKMTRKSSINGDEYRSLVEF